MVNINNMYKFSMLSVDHLQNYKKSSISLGSSYSNVLKTLLLCINSLVNGLLAYLSLYNLPSISSTVNGSMHFVPLRIHPPLHALKMYIFNRPFTSTRIDKRIVHVSRFRLKAYPTRIRYRAAT